MLHTKFPGNRPAGSGEDFHYILGWWPSLSCDLDAANKLLFRRRRTLEHGYTQSNTQYTYISSPCEPDGSGELKTHIKLISNFIVTKIYQYHVEISITEYSSAKLERNQEL